MVVLRAGQVVRLLQLGPDPHRLAHPHLQLLPFGARRLPGLDQHRQPVIRAGKLVRPSQKINVTCDLIDQVAPYSDRTALW